MPAKTATRKTTSRKAPVARLQKVAVDVAAVSRDLARNLGTADTDGAFTPSAKSASTAASARRMELISALLHSESTAAGGDAAPVPKRTALAFSWVPTLDADHNSVSVGLPGVGEVSIGTDGAAASIDGVGGVSVGADGVSVNAGGTSVAVGSDGAVVSVPGAGTVKVGPDGSVSVDGSGGNDCTGLPGFPAFPIPSLCTTELKIPIPVPKFVVEPFEIPVPLPAPTLEQKPLEISIPTVEIETKPVNIEIPTFVPGTSIPLPPDINPFDAMMDAVLSRTLARLLRDMDEVFKRIVKALKKADDAEGNPNQADIARIKASVEALVATLGRLHEAYVGLVDEVRDSPVAITATVQSAWQAVQVFAAQLVEALEDLLEQNLELDDPSEALSGAVRSVYLAIGWILARYARSARPVGEALAQRMIRLGQRLQVINNIS